MAERTKVFHIPGRLAVGVPNTDHEVESKAEAERLVGTGAFALSQKEADAAAFSTPEATPADESNVKKPAYPRTVGAGFDAVVIKKAADEPPAEAPAAPAAAAGE
jgi:hypothetical protein